MRRYVVVGECIPSPALHMETVVDGDLCRVRLVSARRAPWRGFLVWCAFAAFLLLAAALGGLLEHGQSNP